METLKDRLGQVMAEKGLKQIDIARRTGISKGLISILLSDPSKDLLVSNLLLLAKAVGKDPLWLYTGRESGQYSQELLQNIHRVPVFPQSEVNKTMLTRAPLSESNEYVHSDLVGKLIGIKVSDNALQGSGIATGDTAIINLAILEPSDGDIVLAGIRESSSDNLRLLKVVRGIAGMSLAVDDPRIPAMEIEKTGIFGVMLEARKPRRS